MTRRVRWTLQEVVYTTRVGRFEVEIRGAGDRWQWEVSLGSNPYEAGDGGQCRTERRAVCHALRLARHLERVW